MHASPINHFHFVNACMHAWSYIAAAGTHIQRTKLNVHPSCFWSMVTLFRPRPAARVKAHLSPIPTTSLSMNSVITVSFFTVPGHLPGLLDLACGYRNEGYTCTCCHASITHYYRIGNHCLHITTGWAQARSDGYITAGLNNKPTVIS